jgi:hypothetical protein
MSSKVLFETLKLADGGRVECMVQTRFGTTPSIIEKSFFEDFMGMPNPTLSAKQQVRIVENNAEWLAAEAERQLSLGFGQVVIR